MLSKLFANTFKELCFSSTRTMSYRRAFFDFLYKDDKSDANYQAAICDPRRPLDGHTGKTRAELPRKWQTSKLDNGITVLTESQAFPSQVDVGILLDVGTRNETNETSGSLLSIKNTYLKTILNTNETINYGIVQMSGGAFDMEFDQESTYFKAKCLQHDVVDVFNMVSDCALEPRSVLAAQVGADKNKDSHKLDAFLKTGEEFNEQVFKTAFGLKGLGLPLKGLKGNVDNLSSYTLQKFQLDNITPNRIFVCASGIESHEEFLDLAKSKLGGIPAVEGKTTGLREKSQYIGGEVRNLSEDNSIAIGLFFQGGNWKSSDLAAYQTALTLLKNGRLQNLLKKHHYIDCPCAYNFTFSDTGLFGIRAIGSASHGKAILDNIVGEFKGLATKVDQNELQRAKNALKTNIFLALERQTDRLEEGVKNYKTYGKVVYDKYASDIDKVTSDQINKVVAGLLKTQPTFIASGGEANRLPSFDAIKNQLK